jgi:pyruvate-ferredoxin/flavodoxin oxidoreductase
LIRYNPVLHATNNPPFLLDSHRPRLALADYRNRELRYRSLANSDPDEADRLLALAQESVDQRWEVYEDMASRAPQEFPSDARRGH